MRESFRTKNAILSLRLSGPGLVLGGLFFVAALAPSLIPRAGFVQGALAGASFVLGYAAGALGGHLWRFLGLRAPSEERSARLRPICAAFALSVVVLGLWGAASGQQKLHAVMGLPPVETVRPLTILAVAAGVAAALILLGRLFDRLWKALAKRLSWVFPERLALALGLAMAFLVFGFVGDDLLLTRAIGVFDASYQRLDEAISDSSTQPSDPLATGSPASLIPWESIGAKGRERVSDPLNAARIAEISGRPAMEPLRVYVGLGSAEDPQARARLALEEALRVGAFERGTLVVATPTGTGWIDPAGAFPLEVLTHGDVATISTQYSYLPSWLSLLVAPEYGAETARAVFAEIHGHWKTLPPQKRPKLYVFGLSLGALNADLAMSFYDVVQAPLDGVYWVGPPFAHQSWRNITRDRRPGSPAWLPRFRKGEIVRFLNQYDMPDEGAPWGPMRIVALQYASDPITFFSPSIFWSRPDWMRGERGPDVVEEFRWLPLVTGLQTGFDVLTATAAPRGFGHVYAGKDYLRGWISLLSPEGWDEAGYDRIRAALEERGL